jgi:RNA polymerase sigma-70 factor (ECF subfamily)
MLPGRAGVARSPDRAKFIQQSLRPHQPRVESRLCWLFGRARREDVVDALQQAYSQIWATPSIPALKRPAAYLTAVARNILRTTMRREGIVKLSLVDDMDKIQSDLAPEPERPEDAVSREEMLRVIEEAVNRLSPKRRALFVAWMRDRIDLEKVAKERGIALSTADNELYRAIEQVKQQVLARIGPDGLKR